MALVSLLAILAAATAARQPVPALAGLAVALGLAGLALGDARLASIDAGAMRAAPGAFLSVRGTVSAAPRRADGLLMLPLATSRGRLLVETPVPAPDIAVGSGLLAVGRASRGPPWLRGRLRLEGFRTVLEARRLVPDGTRRGGASGIVDTLRRRSEEALGLGMPEREAALARGFVLGQDDRIDARTVEDFRRSGLAHLLAVSGQNVALLALLAAPFLALLGLSLRARLLFTGALIALYVPIAGAGPSIQRAGVMGIAALLAIAAGRPASRLYALLLAAVVTLALNPRAASDVGWQLSFAAVAGILAATPPISAAIRRRLGQGRWQRALADGVGMSAAATIATAPLIAHHFGTVPVASLPANLVALPAVAPSMWLGMLAAAAGQLPGIPVAPLNEVNALLLAYIAQVAAWFGDPEWATLDVRLASPPALLASYALPLALSLLLRRTLARSAAASRIAFRAGAAALGAVLLLPLVLPALRPAAAEPHQPGAGALTVRVLDVGQGDAILLEPPRSPPVLVDAGPADAEVGRRLRDLGVERLAAFVLSHEQSDHAGGVPGLIEEVEVGRFLHARASAGLRASMSAAGAPVTRVAAGDRLRFGALRVDVLWPPRELALLPGPSGDPNSRSIVLLVRWRRFELLLTGDAEAELAPVDPGPVDVLKVAHHGSADPGLDDLLRRIRPSAALISVGENSYGHPAPETLAELRAAGVPALRTDRGGDIVLEVAADRVLVANN